MGDNNIYICTYHSGPEYSWSSVELGAEIEAAEKPCKIGAVRNKSEASACQELPKVPYAPENSNVSTFRVPCFRVCPSKTVTSEGRMIPCSCKNLCISFLGVNHSYMRRSKSSPSTPAGTRLGSIEKEISLRAMKWWIKAISASRLMVRS